VSITLPVPHAKNYKSSSTAALTTKGLSTKGSKSAGHTKRGFFNSQENFVALSQINTKTTLTKRKSQLSDEELIHEITKNGRSDLFGKLYDRYANKVYRKCIGFSKDHETAQDMVQDIFMKVFFQLPKFKGKSRFSTWLYTITYNFCVEYYRRTSKHHFVDIQNQPDEIDESADEMALLQVRSDKLKVAMRQISPEDRAILMMKYQDQTPIKEMMETLEISESAVKMRLARARQRAKEVIDTLPED